MNLYICHTASQVLVDLLRAGRAPDGPHTMVLSTAVADAPALAARPCHSRIHWPPPQP